MMVAILCCLFIFSCTPINSENDVEPHDQYLIDSDHQITSKDIKLLIKQDPEHKYVLNLKAVTNDSSPVYFTLNDIRLISGKYKIEESETTGFSQPDGFGTTYYYEYIDQIGNTLKYSRFKSGRYCAHYENSNALDCLDVLRVLNGESDEVDNYNYKYSYTTPEIDIENTFYGHCFDENKFSGRLVASYAKPNGNIIINRIEAFTPRTPADKKYNISIQQNPASLFTTLETMEYKEQIKSDYILSVAQCEQDKPCEHCEHYNCTERGHECRDSLKNCAHLDIHFRCYTYNLEDTIIQYGTENIDQVKAIMQNDDGNLLVAGTMNIVNSSGYADIILEARSLSFKQIWEKRFNFNQYSRVQDMIQDDEGNIYIVGNSFGELIDTEQPNAGGIDIFLIKTNKQGEFKWSKLYGNGGYDIVAALEIDNKNNIYIGQSVKNDNDVVEILKIDPTSGDIIETISWQHDQNEKLSDLKVDKYGNIYITGMIYPNDPLDFSSPFLVKISPTGEENWQIIKTNHVLDNRRSVGTDIHIKEDGDILWCGETTEVFPDWLFPEDGGAVKDVFVTEFNAEGELLKKSTFGSTIEDIVMNIIPDNYGHYIIMGYSKFKDREILEAFHYFYGSNYSNYRILNNNSETKIFDAVAIFNPDIDMVELYFVGTTNGHFEGYTNLGNEDSFLFRTQGFHIYP